MVMPIQNAQTQNNFILVEQMDQLNTQSTRVASLVLDAFYDQFWEDLKLHRLISKNLTHYSATNTLKFVDQANDENERGHDLMNEENQENQPTPLFNDNLLPISADIDDKNKTISNKLTEMSRISKGNNLNTLRLSKYNVSQISQQSDKKNAPVTQFHSLGYVPDEDEGIIKELRKQHQQELEKEMAEKKKKEREASPNKKQSNRDEKLSFDYNGELVKIRQENRNNIVTGGMNGDLNNKVERLNQAKKDIPHTKIDYDRKNDKRVPVKKPDVFFTDTRVLFSDIQIQKGIKMVEGTVTIEQKDRIIPAKELKKTLSNRRLTKDEYRRVKELTGTVQNFELTNKSMEKSMKTFEETEEKREESLSNLRSASEQKLNESIYKKKSTITVSDPQLLQTLIHGPVNQALAPKIVRKQSSKVDEQFDKLDSIDHFNIDYMKKGNAQASKKSKSVSDLLDTIRLPKLNSTHLIMPKAREKLKDGSNIVRKIRLKFQDKLRL